MKTYITKRRVKTTSQKIKSHKMHHRKKVTGKNISQKNSFLKGHNVSHIMMCQIMCYSIY